MRIRFISASTTREKTAQLRRSLQKETEGLEDPPIFCKLTFDEKQEYHSCVTKMNNLNENLETSFKSADFNSFSASVSRAIHLFGRLNRLSLASRQNRQYVEACKSVKKTLDSISILKFPSKPIKPAQRTLVSDTQNLNVERSPKRLAEGAESIEAQLNNTLASEAFDDNDNFRSSSIKMSSNPEFRSLAEKVDRLTESFEKFLQRPYVTRSEVESSKTTRTNNDHAYPENVSRNNPVDNLNADHNGVDQNRIRVPRFYLPDPYHAGLVHNPIRHNQIRNPTFQHADQDHMPIRRNPIRNQPIQREDQVHNPIRPNPIRNQPIVYEDRRFQTAQRRTKKTIPINQWNVKFSGDGGISLSEFLEEVELFAQSEQFSEEELFASAIHLFSGHARKWFKANYDDLISWTELVAALREEFESENYDYILLSEIDSRFQGKEEPFSSFLAELRILFGKLSCPLSEKYNLYILKKNMISSHAMAIATLNINSVRELSIICKRLDATKMLQDKQNPLATNSSRFVEPAYRTPLTKKVFKNNLNEVEVSEIPFQEDNEISELSLSRDYRYSNMTVDISTKA